MNREIDFTIRARTKSPPLSSRKLTGLRIECLKARNLREVRRANRLFLAALCALLMGAALVWLLASPALAGEVDIHSGWVIKAYDGDTIKLADKTRVRITCIDTPEMAQPYGPAAKDFAVDELLGRFVAVHAVARDKWGRLLGRVLVGGKDYSAAVVAAGLAWATCRELRPIQAEAKAARRGLWIQDNPVRPSRFRKSQRGK